MGVYLHKEEPYAPVDDITGRGFSNTGGTTQGICVTPKIDCTLDKVIFTGNAGMLCVAQGTGISSYISDTLAQYTIPSGNEYVLSTPYEMEANTMYVIWGTGGADLSYSNIQPLPIDGTNVITNYSTLEGGYSDTRARGISSITTTEIGVEIIEKELSNAYIGRPFPESIVLNKSSISLTTIGQTEQLTATIEPTISDHSITWSSDDTTVATVSTEGLVTCVTPGTCTITATTVNGLTATCSVGKGWQPTANTLWYLNLDQSNAVFTDTQGHTVTNNGIVYNANGVSGGCGYNNSNGKRLYSDFNVGESFPTSFTIMCFMKPTGNHYTNDHPMGISIANASTKVTWGIGFNQSNSQVQFNYLREAIAWNTQSHSYSPLNTWHHYALTYNGSTVKGYIDGSQVVSFSASGSGSGTGPSGGLTVFGRNHPSYTNTIQGYVDEAICEDKVWTAQEIQDYLALYSY